jgi:hypothetical protein
MTAGRRDVRYGPPITIVKGTRKITLIGGRFLKIENSSADRPFSYGFREGERDSGMMPNSIPG